MRVALRSDGPSHRPFLGFKKNKDLQGHVCASPCVPHKNHTLETSQTLLTEVPSRLPCTTLVLAVNVKNKVKFNLPIANLLDDGSQGSFLKERNERCSNSSCIPHIARFYTKLGSKSQVPSW